MTPLEYYWKHRSAAEVRGRLRLVRHQRVLQPAGELRGPASLRLLRVRPGQLLGRLRVERGTVGPRRIYVGIENKTGIKPELCMF